MFGKKTEETPDLEMFTIYDTKVGNYRDPIFAINRFDMLRGIESFFRNPVNANDQMSTNSEDFQVFKIGSYIRKTGTVSGHHPEHIANLHEIRAITLQRETARPLPNLE